MAFSSLTFLLYFFPLSTILLYLLFGREGKTQLQAGKQVALKVCMLFVSLFFYAWGEPKRILILMGLGGINFLFLKMAETRGKRLHRYVSLALIALNILALIWGKYWAKSLPLGMSFYVFRLISSDLDRLRMAREEERLELRLLDYFLYLSFFPQVISGPIQRYEDFTKQSQVIRIQSEALVLALGRFLPALFIKVLLADNLILLHGNLLAFGSLGVLESLLAAVIYALYIYLDFASYSAMAIALSGIFGISCPENFNHPYGATSVSDFWRRWHMSLSSFFRDYVYIPLGGNRKGTRRQILNICIVWALTGIWHGQRLNFLLWGLYYALFLILEKFFTGKILSKAPLFLQKAVTFSIVTFGWILFAFPDSKELISFVVGLFGANGLSNGSIIYLLKNSIVLLLLSILASSSLAIKAREKVRNILIAKQQGVKILLYIVFALLFIITFAFIVDQSFASFLYFQF